jgi:hypothetical protein
MTLFLRDTHPSRVFVPASESRRFAQCLATTISEAESRNKIVVGEETTDLSLTNRETRKARLNDRERESWRQADPRGVISSRGNANAFASEHTTSLAEERSPTEPGSDERRFSVSGESFSMDSELAYP